MQSKNYPPKAAHKHWHDWIRENFNYCHACGGPAEELHHIPGTSPKENKIWVGQWAVTMLCSACNHDNSKLRSKKAQLYMLVNDVVGLYWKKFKEIPMSSDELMAILTWSR